MIDDTSTTLRHTDLTVPHRRLAVTSLQQLERYNGVAFTATLCLDGTVVGTIDNDGNGGQTWLVTTNSNRRAAGLDEYVAACRQGGEPVTEEYVLNALVDEYDFDQQIADLAAAGGTMARIYHCGCTFTIAGADPNRPADRLLTELRDSHPEYSMGMWQIWDTDHWTDLGPAVA